MSDSRYSVYGYRWVVLAVFMLVNLAIQVLWIAYAPITGPAAHFYGVTDLQIGLLAMTFMIAFIPMSIPVSWMIDTYGFRRAVGVGSVLMAVFAILRGLAGAHYAYALACTVGLAIAQPFLMNSWTKVPANWFPIGERATAVGLVILSSLTGVALGMALTPALAERFSIPTVQLIYGGVACVAALLFVVVVKEHPPTSPGPAGSDARALMLDGLKHALTVPGFWLYLLVWFIGMSVFNGISTWIENIVRPRGFTPAQAGQIGAVMLIGGILGALIIPALSDRQHRRQRYMLLGPLLAIPGVAGLAFGVSFPQLLLSAFALGFFLVSSSPVGMQYAAEITHPTPEGTSAGLLQLFGQLSVCFIFVMDAIKSKDGSFTRSLLVAMGLLAVSVLVVTRLKDSLAVAPNPQSYPPPALAPAESVGLVEDGERPV
jgi:MFS family permease